MSRIQEFSQTAYWHQLANENRVYAIKGRMADKPISYVVLNCMEPKVSIAFSLNEERVMEKKNLYNKLGMQKFLNDFHFSRKRFLKKMRRCEVRISYICNDVALVQEQIMDHCCDLKRHLCHSFDNTCSV